MLISGSTISPPRCERGTTCMMSSTSIVMPSAVHIRPQLFARLEAIHPGILPRVFVERRVTVHDVDQRQIVALPDFVVVEVVTRRDLERARAELRDPRIRRRSPECGG